jgi:hypothetical protein
LIDAPALFGDPDLLPGIVCQVDIDRLAVSGIPKVHILLRAVVKPYAFKVALGVPDSLRLGHTAFHPGRRATVSTV